MAFGLDLLNYIPGNTPLKENFKFTGEIITQGVRSLICPVGKRNYVRVDIIDLRMLFHDGRIGSVRVGTGRGRNRASEAAINAIRDKECLLGVGSPCDAGRIWVCIEGNNDLTRKECEKCTSIICDIAHPDANIVISVMINEGMGDTLRVTLLSAG